MKISEEERATLLKLLVSPNDDDFSLAVDIIKSQYKNSHSIVSDLHSVRKTHYYDMSFDRREDRKRQLQSLIANIWSP